jgi:hypothetical protein
MLPADTKQHYHRRTQVREDNEDHEAAESEAQRIADIEELTQICSGTLQEKMAFIETSDVDGPDVVLLLAMQLKYWITVISTMVEDGEVWLASGELGWIETLNEAYDAFILSMEPVKRTEAEQACGLWLPSDEEQ